MARERAVREREREREGGALLSEPEAGCEWRPRCYITTIIIIIITNTQSGKSAEERKKSSLARRFGGAGLPLS